MIYAGILAGGTGTRMGISNLPKQFLELGDRPILIHTIEKFVLEPSIEKIVVGVHGDWVSHAEDLVDKYLPLHKDRIIITKGGADRNTSIEKIIEAIDAYRPLTPEDIVVTHDSVRPFITLRMIQDNIQLAQNHDAVDTVVEVVDTSLKALMVNLLQIFQIVLTSIKDKHLKRSVARTSWIFTVLSLPKRKKS